MRLLVILALLVTSPALGQGLTTRAPGQTGQKRTNWILQSNSMSSGELAVSPWSLNGATVTTVGGAPASAGGGTWAEVVSPTNGDYITQAFSTATTRDFVVSGWLAKASGTGEASLAINCVSTPTVCTCSMSDGSACTGANLSVYCHAFAGAVGTTPVRMTVMVSCTDPTNSPAALIWGGHWTASAGTTRWTGIQVETGVTKASKICVTTTAAKTCK